MRFTPFLLSSSAVIGLMMGTGVAVAQGPTAAAPTTVENDPINDPIVVTGTRIRRPNLGSTVPITTLDAEDVLSTGNLFVGEMLDELPMTVTSVGQQNSKDTIGAAGLNLLDLRGLGTSRTLVLQNGRRHVGSVPGTPAVDVNSIPAALIERIDIVTGGNSSIYGSDAVAGVVNFILKRDFEGVEARGQAGISSRGDRGSYRVSLTAGRNFGGGRGNIAVSGEYSRANRVEMTQRARDVGAVSGYGDFELVENPSNEPGGSDGITDYLFLTGLRNPQYDANGMFIATNGQVSVTSACSVALNQCRPNGYPRYFRFNPDGTLAEANYGTDYRGPSGGNTVVSAFGDTGDTRTSTGQLVPEVERYSTNLLAHYDLSDAFKPYLEAKYVRVNFDGERGQPFINTRGPQLHPLFFRNGEAGFGGIPIYFDNPYLAPSAAATIKSLLPAGATFFKMTRLNRDFGRIVEKGKRETIRVVAGVEGDFNGDWHYDLSFNYGEFEQNSRRSGERFNQRYVLAADAVRDPTTGKIICRSQLPGQITPQLSLVAADQTEKAADIAACVPVNLFGDGSPSQAAIDYFSASFPIKIRNTQKVVSGFLSGDTSDWFELPGGPVGFAVGGELRREGAYEDFSDLARSGRISYVAGPVFDPEQKYEVREAFGELNIPLLADRPFFHELTLSGAARIADYSGRTGTVLAWNAGGIWAPVRDIRLRANYAVAVRAPNLSELYRPLRRVNTVIDDPCDAINIGNAGPNRIANCRAAGVPEGFLDPNRGASIPIVEGGNPQLKHETSKSWTIGAVAQPRLIPGLSLSVDYYDVRIDDAISLLFENDLATSCYDAPSLDNEFCKAVFRDPVTHAFSLNPPFYAAVVGGVNYSGLKVRGIDFQAAYQARLGELGSLSTRLIATYVLESNSYPFADAPDRPDQVLLETGFPRFQGNLNVDFKTGPVTIGYQGRYISKQLSSQFFEIENFKSVGGNPPTDADALDPIFAPGVWYHDFRAGFDVDRRLNFYIGVDNVFDRKPPFGRYGFNLDLGAAIYDTIGRYFYAGAVVKF